MEQPTNTSDTKSIKEFTPEVTWAQRSSSTEAKKNHIFLTISVPDVDPKKIKLDIQPGSLTFTGYSDSRKATYHLALDFYAEIDPKESKINHTPRDVEMVLQKKDLQEEYWPRLLKEKARVHYLKTNFDRWVDEDEQDDATEDDDYMSRMGGAGGAGGMGGGDGGGGFGGIDFSKLGGAGGMGGMGGAGGMPDMEEMMKSMGGGGMPGMGSMGEDDEDDDDEEMPELESEETGKTDAESGAPSSKIEEVE